MPPQHRKAQLGWSHGDLGFNVGQVAPTCLGTPYLEIAAISRALARAIPEDRSNSCSGSPRLTTAYKTNVLPSQIKDEIRRGRRAQNSPPNLEIGSCNELVPIIRLLCLGCNSVNRSLRIIENNRRTKLFVTQRNQ